MLPIPKVDALLKVLLPIAAAIAIVVAAYYSGKQSCKVATAEAQRDQAVETRELYEKIDRNLPSDADLSGIADFLLKRAKGN